MTEINLMNGNIQISGKTLSFKFDIAEYIELNNIIVVRLKVPTDIIFNENIFGVNTDGKIVWQIVSREFMHKNSPYTNMKKVNNSRVNLSNWDGTQVLINPNNGNILDEKWVK